MTMLYWFALVVGAGLLLMSLFGDFFGDHHVDLGGGGDADLGGDVHADAEGFRLLSLRNATYFLFAFGASGVLLGWVLAGDAPVLTAVLATLLGVAGGGISAVAFGWLRKTESGYLGDDRGWAGRVGEVVLPLSAEGTGKIMVNRNGRDHELLARPFDREPESPEQWRTVVIVELENGVAMVSPYTGALDAPEAMRISPGTE